MAFGVRERASLARPISAGGSDNSAGYGGRRDADEVPAGLFSLWWEDPLQGSITDAFAKRQSGSQEFIDLESERPFTRARLPAPGLDFSRPRVHTAPGNRPFLLIHPAIPPVASTS